MCEGVEGEGRRAAPAERRCSRNPRRPTTVWRRRARTGSACPGGCRCGGRARRAAAGRRPRWSPSLWCRSTTRPTGSRRRGRRAGGRWRAQNRRVVRDDCGGGRPAGPAAPGKLSKDELSADRALEPPIRSFVPVIRPSAVQLPAAARNRPLHVHERDGHLSVTCASREHHGSGRLSLSW